LLTARLRRSGLDGGDERRKQFAVDVHNQELRDEAAAYRCRRRALAGRDGVPLVIKAAQAACSRQSSHSFSI
jgi:hypothetical protein